MMEKRTLIIIAVIALLGTNFATYTIMKNKQGPAVVEQAQSNKANHPASGMRTAQKAPAKPVQTEKAKKVTGPQPGKPVQKGDLSWLHIEDAGKLKNKEGKKFLVDVYTDWCGWCKVLDKQTFTDPEIQKFLNDNFHVVKFNAEQRDPIKFQGQTYELVKSGRNGVNALAVKMLGQRLSYPALVYLDENLNQVHIERGFKKPEQLMQTLKMIAG